MKNKQITEHDAKEAEPLKLENRLVAITQTTRPQLIKLLEKFNAEYHPSISISTYDYDKKTILVRSQDLPSNPNGVYTFLTVSPKGINCEYYKVNDTWNYLKQFYDYIVRGEHRRK